MLFPDKKIGNPSYRDVTRRQTVERGPVGSCLSIRNQHQAENAALRGKRLLGFTVPASTAGRGNYSIKENNAYGNA